VPISGSRNQDGVVREAILLRDRLSAVARVRLDDREHLTPGKKFNEWELKGVPLRIELGPRDLKQGSVVLARRDTFEKRSAKLSSIESEVRSELKAIQENLLRRATEFLRKNTHQTNSYEKLKSIIDERGGVVQAPWCGSEDCEAKVKDETGAKIINIPLEQDSPVNTCVYCGRPGKVVANFARSY
jgi:prolyl-tRNA synthetase